MANIIYRKGDLIENIYTHERGKIVEVLKYPQSGFIFYKVSYVRGEKFEDPARIVRLVFKTQKEDEKNDSVPNV